jgi:hypothetical protein
MSTEEHRDITNTEADLIFLARIMEYKKLDEAADFNSRINSNAETLLAILKSFNIVFRNFIVVNIIAKQESDVMPGHDLTSRLFEKIKFSLDGIGHTELAYRVRPSIVKEIFYSLYEYSVMSAICGRIEKCATCGDLNDCDNYWNHNNLMVTLVQTYDYIKNEFKEKIYCPEPSITPDHLFDLSRLSMEVYRAVDIVINRINSGINDPYRPDFYKLTEEDS